MTDPNTLFGIEYMEFHCYIPRPDFGLAPEPPTPKYAFRWGAFGFPLLIECNEPDPWRRGWVLLERQERIEFSSQSVTGLRFSLTSPTQSITHSLKWSLSKYSGHACVREPCDYAAFFPSIEGNDRQLTVILQKTNGLIESSQ